MQRVKTALLLVLLINLGLMFLLLPEQASSRKPAARAEQARSVPISPQQRKHVYGRFFHKKDSCRGEGPTKPTKQGRDAVWQVVGDGKNVFVYSAFHDNVSTPAKIRLIVVSNGESRHPPRYCQLWYRSKSYCITTRIEEDIIPETHNLRYSPFVYSCRVDDSTEAPYAVSLAAKICSKPKNLVKVRVAMDTAKPKYKFAVCVTPLNYDYRDKMQLVEMMELNRLLGADHVVFYNYSAAPSISRHFNYYKQRGLVTVHSWKLPIGVDTWPKNTSVPVEIHYFGQLAALNDCLYRYMQQAEYLVFTDLDEFVVPRATLSWSSYVDSLRLPESFGAMSFRCAFFRKDWTSDDAILKEYPDAAEYELNSILKTYRESKIQPLGVRSKLIVRPKSVFLMGVHTVWRYRDEEASLYIAPSKEALLHHYRDWENPVMQDFIRDPIIAPLFAKILNRTKHVHNSIL